MYSFQFIHFNSLMSFLSFQFIRVNYLMSIASFQFLHITSFITILSFQFIHFDLFVSMFKSFTSIPSSQLLHLSSSISFPSFPFFQFNSFLLIHSVQFMRFNFKSFMSLDSCQFMHFIHFISFHFNSFLSNSTWIPINHVLFSKLPLRHVPGTTWYWFCWFNGRYMPYSSQNQGLSIAGSDPVSGWWFVSYALWIISVNPPELLPASIALTSLAVIPSTIKDYHNGPQSMHWDSPWQLF